MRSSLLRDGGPKRQASQKVAGTGRCICLFKQLFGKPDVLAPRPAAGWTASRRPAAKMDSMHADARQALGSSAMHAMPSASEAMHASSSTAYPLASPASTPATSSFGLALHSWCHSFGVPEGSCPLFVGLSATVGWLVLLACIFLLRCCLLYLSRRRGRRSGLPHSASMPNLSRVRTHNRLRVINKSPRSHASRCFPLLSCAARPLQARPRQQPQRRQVATSLALLSRRLRLDVVTEPLLVSRQASCALLARRQ